MERLSLCLLLLLAQLSNIGAVPSFNDAEANNLIEKLKNGIREENARYALGMINCYDPATPNNDTRITIEEGVNFIELLPYNFNFGTVYVKAGLDYEILVSNKNQQNEKTISLACTSVNGKVVVEAKMVINDINDNTPVWIGDSYSASINEVLPGPLPMAVIVDPPIIVEDRDGVDNSNVIPNCTAIEISPGNILEPCINGKYFNFQAHPYNGQSDYRRWYFNITATRLTYTGITSFKIILNAVNAPMSASENTRISETRNVLVVVQDIQNMPPIFDQNTLSFTMSEARQPRVEVEVGKTIRASDQDTGTPNAIRFVLLRNPDDGYAFDQGFFELGTTVESLPGRVQYAVQLILKKSIDREAIPNEGKTLALNIQAIEYDPENRTNRNPMNTTNIVSIQIEDVNDMPPKFNQPVYTYRIGEKTNIVTNDYQQLTGDGFQIVVSDDDSFLYNSFEVSIISGGRNTDFSFLNFTRGQRSQAFLLYVRSQLLDFETGEKNYSLTLQARDTNRPELTSTAVVRVEVSDVNDNSPVFLNSSYNFFVKENVPLQTIVGTIRATDVDGPSYGIVSAYEIKDTSDTFIIDNNGNIILTKALDFETRTTYTFTATALDNGIGNEKKSGTTRVNIVVENVFDVGPIFRQSYQSSIFEESLDLLPSIVVRAENQESQGQITYSIPNVTPSTLPANTFSVNPTTGVVSVLRTINYMNTDNGTIFVTFRATSDGGLFNDAIATITVYDLNNFEPEFLPAGQKQFSASVSELAAAGFVVIDLNVRDNDTSSSNNGRVEFQIVSGANDDFTIRQDSGEIIVTANAKLELEKQALYIILVEARDKGNPQKSATATVSISILDANNKPPSFQEQLYVFQINEGDPVGKQINRTVATDPDTSGVLSYSIDYATANFEKRGNKIETFIDAKTILRIVNMTGMLEVAGAIDRSTYDRIDFKVIATDVNTPANQPKQTATASVMIFILAAVDPRIYFDPPWTRDQPIIRKTYSESMNSGYQVMTLRATDPVLSEFVETYQEVPATDRDDYFQVNGRNVIIRKPLDYEALPFPKTVSVVVWAISRDGLRTGTATIEINVQDLNDNEPVFDKQVYMLKVPEDRKHPFRVGEVMATDADSTSYGDITYSLAGSGSSDFGVYTETSGSNMKAVIFVSETANLDYETYPEYNLQLIAEDNVRSTTDVKNRASTTLIIIVEDRNDIVPHFNEDLYEFSIIGTQETGIDVGFVFAMDEDSGLNGEVEYSLNVLNNDEQYFGIETVNVVSSRLGENLKRGRIFVRRSLESLPDRKIFSFDVFARDKGTSPKQGQSKVKITVSKGVQDLKPKWNDTMPSKIQIPENRPLNSEVTRVQAFPANASSSIRYSFLGTGDTLRDFESFNIGANTGIITVAKTFDYEQKHIYNLQILATDSMNTTLTNQFLLIVEITDVDDNDPSFTTCPNRRYQGRIYPIPVPVNVREEEPKGLFVYQVQACDLDQHPNNIINYVWYMDPSLLAERRCNETIMPIFNLNSTTGVITTKVVLDREMKDQYLLCVEAVKAPSRGKRDLSSVLTAKNISDNVLFVQVIVDDVNDKGPTFANDSLRTVINKYPDDSTVAVAEAVDQDLSPSNQIRYSIVNMTFTMRGKTQSAPTAFIINANDGTISIGTNDYSDYIDGYFDIHVKAEDMNGANTPASYQKHRVYITDRTNFIRVVFDRPADSGIEITVREMITDLNKLEAGRVFYKVMSVSYHVRSNVADPDFSATDVCMVVVRDDSVMSSLDAVKSLNDMPAVRQVISGKNAGDAGTCDPAMSVYPTGWESYWWVLVAFAIFIFVCCCILMVLICVLYKDYNDYMNSRRTYMVPGQ
ncbi:protocadherin Fat 3-like isoform X3 [Dreissena polymorpha]|uniref:protocadherin Fat 3-like isoform X3 n=1 Tax=Dreissena polymorpha TaxID=45954 RepID=UPI00226431E8|nr:protocadherin Fat 3-like isoform X3 [Dreissena polymorpha]